MNAKVHPLITPVEIQPASQDIWSTKYQLKTKSGDARRQGHSTPIAVWPISLAARKESIRAKVLKILCGHWKTVRSLLAVSFPTRCRSAQTRNLHDQLHRVCSIMDSMDDILLKTTKPD